MSAFFSFFAMHFGWFLAFALAPAAVYVCSYIVFRLWGKLRVNAEGWHASSIDAGTRVMLSALRLFGWFQPLMRVESAVSRRLVKWFKLQSRDQSISEVVVELIPIS